MTVLHTLLLDSSHQCLGFITEKKAIKLLIKDKAEVLEEWTNKISYISGNFKHPATLRLKSHRANWLHKSTRFSKMLIFRRDQYLCQYCAAPLTSTNITIDHIVPRSRGGINSYTNCVSSCYPCNRAKGNRTPEEAKMRLINKPSAPTMGVVFDYRQMAIKHDGWKNYFSG